MTEQGNPEGEKTGLGAALNSPALPSEVQDWIRRGYPRLAYTRHNGVPFAPWIFSLRFTFDTPDPQVSPLVQIDVGRISQDTVVDTLLARVVFDLTEMSPFDAPSDNAFNFTNKIEATLDISGAPRYAVAEEFTPISMIADAFNGDSKWPYCWVLTYQNGVKAQFQNRVLLPKFPATVFLTFRTWQPVTDLLVNMTTREAVEELRRYGYTIPDRYLDYLR